MTNKLKNIYSIWKTASTFLNRFRNRQEHSKPPTQNCKVSWKWPKKITPKYIFIKIAYLVDEKPIGGCYNNS